MSTLTATAPTVKPTTLPSFAVEIVIRGAIYFAEPIPAGESGLAAVRLTKRSLAGETYDVVLTEDGLVECDCPSYEFTHRGTAGTCKHGAACLAKGLLVVRSRPVAEFADLAADDESACPITEADHRAWEARRRARLARFIPSPEESVEWAAVSRRAEEEAEDREYDQFIDNLAAERMAELYVETGSDWHESERIAAVGCLMARIV